MRLSVRQEETKVREGFHMFKRKQVSSVQAVGHEQHTTPFPRLCPMKAGLGVEKDATTCKADLLSLNGLAVGFNQATSV